MNATLKRIEAKLDVIIKELGVNFNDNFYPVETKIVTKSNPMLKSPRWSRNGCPATSKYNHVYFDSVSKNWGSRMHVKLSGRSICPGQQFNKEYDAFEDAVKMSNLYRGTKYDPKKLWEGPTTDDYWIDTEEE